MLKGSDAGVSFSSAYDPTSELLYTVMSNTSAGAWPLVELLDGLHTTAPAVSGGGLLSG